MSEHVDKPVVRETQTVASEVAQKRHGEPALQFVDNRASSAAQRKLQALAGDSVRGEKAQNVQRMADAHAAQAHPIQRKENRTGLPDTLKSGVESLSGYSLDAVKVHYNSDKPRQLQAHAYAQGTDIYLGAGQERHLPHEAWHVVQQAQGRVRPTMQMKDSVPVNDDRTLEHEADVMGARALTSGTAQRAGIAQLSAATVSGGGVAQRSVTSDIAEAKTDIARTTGYSDRVLDGVNEYSQKIEYAESQKHTHSKVGPAMVVAAGGLKAWAANYYNKAQAYLYEAQKANDHTNVSPSSTVWHFAKLGQDTDKEPDMETLMLGHASGVEQSSRRAIELKTCTTEDQANVAKLVQEGLAQLQKREATGQFSSLLLTVHNDHPNNIYPYTPPDLAGSDLKTLFSDTATIENKLLERINGTAKGAGIKLPLEVRLEHNGKRYATVHYN